MFDNNIQARMMVPVAISLAYGVLFASVVTLFLVPSLYLVLDDLSTAWARRSNAVQRRETAAEVTGTGPNMERPPAAGREPSFSSHA